MVIKTGIAVCGLLMIFGMAEASQKLLKQVNALTKRVGKLEGCDPCATREKLRELEKEVEALKQNVTELQQLECQNYRSLNNADRKVTFVTTPSPTIACDKDLGPGWFRFEGDAGTKMADVCPLASRCGTYSTGWLKGGHPTVADGRVTRKACFSWTTDCCTWSIDIKVRNCGNYFVYYIDGTPRKHQCSLGYCGSD